MGLRVAMVLAAAMMCASAWAASAAEAVADPLASLSADAAVRLAETIRRTCAESPVEWNGMAAPVTISIGVAFSPALPIQLNALIVRADEALYDAKRMGRNRVCAATATVPTASAASAAATAITGWTASAVDANLLRYR